jgi:SH3 domain protein
MACKLFVFALALAIVGTARAETAYITDQLYVSLRPGQDNDAPPIKGELSGTTMEVLQHANGFAQVRDPAGVEGWIAERYLSSDPPPKTRLAALQQQILGLTQELAEARNQAQQAQSGADRANSQLTNQQNEVPAPRKLTDVPQMHSPIAGIIVIAVTASFAMLIVGFVAGAMWLRAVNRKRLGGMDLRI